MYKVNYFSLEKKNEDVKSITFQPKTVLLKGNL